MPFSACYLEEIQLLELLVCVKRVEGQIIRVHLKSLRVLSSLIVW